MGRIVKNMPVDLPAVTTEPKAWTQDAESTWDSYREAKDGAQFKRGDVVWLLDGNGFRKGVVFAAFPERNPYDDWRIRYRVLGLNKDGKTWSKMFHDTWIGQIQRAYFRAGALPPEEARLFEEER